MKTGWAVVTLMMLLAIPLDDAAETGGRLTFETTSHDFGKVLYGDKVTYVFVVTNSEMSR